MTMTPHEQVRELVSVFEKQTYDMGQLQHTDKKKFRQTELERRETVQKIRAIEKEHRLHPVRFKVSPAIFDYTGY